MTPMKIRYGNLWSSDDNLIMVTSNSYIKTNGELVMGRGAALEMKQKFPAFPKLFGDQIKHLSRYGLVFAQSWYYGNAGNKIYHNKMYGIFQVKYHFKDAADLELIEYSTTMLKDDLINYPEISSVSMNFPGIGNGMLEMDEVMPIVAVLPDSVTLYIRGDNET